MGVSAVVFVLFLAISGITLNHATDLGLDRRYVNWSWLLDAYGIQSPPPSGSFVDTGYRATLLGERLFLNGQDTGQRVAALVGFIAVEPLVLAVGQQTAHILTTDGDLVEIMDLSAVLPGPIERVGRAGNRAIVQSNSELFRSDPGIAMFAPWHREPETDIQWSAESSPDAAERVALDAAWRGHGLTVERILLDLHSGRLFALPGTLFMDLIALCMIVLGVSGLVLSNSRYRRENGPRNGKRG